VWKLLVDIESYICFNITNIYNLNSLPRALWQHPSIPIRCYHASQCSKVTNVTSFQIISNEEAYFISPIMHLNSPTAMLCNLKYVPVPAWGGVIWYPAHPCSRGKKWKTSIHFYFLTMKPSSSSAFFNLSNNALNSPTACASHLKIAGDWKIYRSSRRAMANDVCKLSSYFVALFCCLTFEPTIQSNFISMLFCRTCSKFCWLSVCFQFLQLLYWLRKSHLLSKTNTCLIAHYST